jgi:hypothetical protein
MTRGGPPVSGFGVGLTTLHHKRNTFVTKDIQEPGIWADSLNERPKRCMEYIIYSSN